MIALLSAWVKEIILVVLFATFVEFLLPNSSMQRFVRVIMGLFIMLAILNPIMAIVDKNWRSAQVPALSTYSSGSTDIQNKTGSVANDRTRIAGEIFRKDVARQIRALVIAVEGVAEARVNVDVEGQDDGKYTGAVKKIIVYVKPGINGADKIPKVSIGDQQTTEELSPVIVLKIKRTIAELYQLRQHQIEVQRMN